MKVNGKTDIGCNRPENQDTFRSGSTHHAAWGIVCDGMGGAQHGKLASAVAADCTEEMIYQLLEKEPAETAEEILKSAVDIANGEVFALSGNGKQLMGTTMVCALFRNKVLSLSHVGDSRAYLYTEGMLRQLTRDHSMVQEMVDMGTITKDEAKTHPEKNVITRALGVEGTVDASFDEYHLQSGDLVILCSDGFSNMVSEEKFKELIETYDYWDLAREMINEALKLGGEDNITVVLMKAEDKDF